MTQTELQLEPRCKPLVRGTQHYEILMYLKQGGRLTVAKAMSELDVYALSQRIGELKKMGWPICTEMIQVHSGKRVACYWMPEGGSYA